jgi:hypothetical protein
MPAVSQAQARKIQLLYEQGKITKAERDRFLKGVKISQLPKRKRKKK